MRCSDMATKGLRTAIGTGAAFVVFAPALADDALVVAAPAFTVGDAWIYERTQDQGSAGPPRQRVALRVERIDGDAMLVGVSLDDRPPSHDLVGLDWSHRGAANGQETVTGRPLSFPLSVGQSWTADYTTPLKHGRPGFARFRTTYKAVGWTDVATPAGVFRTLEVEARGTIETHLASATPVAPGHRRASPRGGKAPPPPQSPSITIQGLERDAFYYAPKLKAFAKIVEEQYDAQAVRVTQDTQVLTAFRTGP